MMDHTETADDEPLDPPLTPKTRDERIDAIVGGCASDEDRRRIGESIDALDHCVPPGFGDLRNYRLRVTSAPPSGTLGLRSRAINGARLPDTELKRRLDLAQGYAEASESEMTALRERLRSDPEFLAEFPATRRVLCVMHGVTP